MKLLKLAPEIREYVDRLRDPKEIQYFSIRRLMPLAELSHDNQCRQFREWRSEFERQVSEAGKAVAASMAPLVYPIRPRMGSRPGVGI
jgi:hypothetical protein